MFRRKSSSYNNYARAHPSQSLISRYAQTIGIYRYHVKRQSAIRYIVTTKTKYNKNMLNWDCKTKVKKLQISIDHKMLCIKLKLRIKLSFTFWVSRHRGICKMTIFDANDKKIRFFRKICPVCFIISSKTSFLNKEGRFKLGCWRVWCCLSKYDRHL